MAKYITEANAAAYVQVDQGKEKTFESQLFRSNLFLSSLKDHISEQKDYFMSMRENSDSESRPYLTGIIDGLSNTLSSIENLQNILYPNS